MSALKGKKHKRKKGSKAKPNGDLVKANGAIAYDEHEIDDAEGEEQESKTPTEPPSSPQKAEIDPAPPLTNGTRRKINDNVETSAEPNTQSGTVAQETSLASEDGLSGDKITILAAAADTDARLEALVNERNALREEVAQVRRSLEEIKEKHEEELGSIRVQIADTQGEKEQAETQYRNLLGKVNTIRSQLGERLKADAVGIRLPLPLRRSCYYRKTYRRHEVE